MPSCRTTSCFAHISQTQLSPVEFLQALLVEFGFKPFRKRKVELLSMLKDFMVEQYAAGKKILLIIDEAQNLSRKVLEEVRLLSGLELQKEKLLRIIIAGQPELSHKLDSPRLQQLMQRVRLRFHLGALSKRETHEYIAHRLDIAGANGRTIFEPAACDIVFRYAGGVPRLINVLCDTAMLCAFAEERTVVDERLVKAAVEELQWVEFSERMREQQRHTRARASSPRATRPMARLEMLYRDQLVGEFRIGLGKAIIGRTADNDVQIQSRFVSRHHAQIVSDEKQSVLEDLNSTNGVFIRSKRVKHHALADGDIIQLGEHKLLYRDMRGSVPQALGRRRRRRGRTSSTMTMTDDDELTKTRTRTSSTSRMRPTRKSATNASADARSLRPRRWPRRLSQTNTPAARLTHTDHGADQRPIPIVDVEAREQRDRAERDVVVRQRFVDRLGQPHGCLV